MNIKTTLILLVLLVAVGGVFLVLRSGDGGILRGGATAITGEEDESLWGERAPSPEEVTHLTIERGNRIITLAREDDRWYQIEPVRFPMQSQVVNTVVQHAVGLRYDTTFMPGRGDYPSVEETSLAPPRATVTLRTGEREHAVHLGRRWLDGRGYAMLEGETSTAYIVSDDLHRSVLDGSLDEWRTRELDPPRMAEAHRVELKHEDAALGLHKIHGRWFLDPEGQQRANESAVDALLRQLAETKIESFAADAPGNLGGFGLDEPRLEMQVAAPSFGMPAMDGSEDRADRRWTLRIGSAADLEGERYFATWTVGDDTAPVVFTLSADVLEGLTAEPEGLRDPRVFTVSSAREIRELQVQRRDHADLRWERDSRRGLAFADPAPDFSLDYSAAAEMLERLESLRAIGFVSDFEPAEAPIGRVVLTQRGAGGRQELSIYEPDDQQRDAAYEGDQLLAVREGDSVAYRLDREALQPLFEPLSAWRDHTLMDLGSDRIASVTLDHPEAPPLKFTRLSESADAWQLSSDEGDGSPATDDFEQRELQRLLSMLYPLRAEQWHRDAPVLDPRHTAGLNVTDNDGRTYELHIDLNAGIGVMEGVDEAFVLNEAFVGQLEREYRHRTVLPVALRQIRELTVEEDDRSLTIRRGRDGRYRSDVDRPARRSAAARLFDTLAGLQVERYLNEPSTDLAVRRRLRVMGSDGLIAELTLLSDSAGRTLARLDEIDHALHDGLPSRYFSLSERALEHLTAGLLEDEDDERSAEESIIAR